MKKPILKLDWASHEAAKYACLNWHYTRTVPKSKLVKIGVWEDDSFRGCIIYGLGANKNLMNLYGKTCELVRIALRSHVHEVTKMVSISIKMLKNKCPELNAIVSYADLDRHQGKIYKAGNWKEIGTASDPKLVIHGKEIHPKTIFDRYGTRSISYLQKNIDPNAKYIKTKGKKRFVYFLKKR